MTEAQSDIRWLIAWAERNKLRKPTSDEMEAFSERVALKLDGAESAGAVSIARYQAAIEWEERCRG